MVGQFGRRGPVGWFDSPFQGRKAHPLRTIAIINQKGGCGKTTVSINLAAVLAGKGHKCLLVDMDPQAHCAIGLAVPDGQIKQSMRDMFRAGLNGSLAFGDIVWQISKNLDLAPSTMSLAAVEQELAGAADKDRRLLQLLCTIEDQYEFCVIDCPPSIGLLTFNALRAADEIIVPVETGYFALQGSTKQEATIEMLARRFGHIVRFRVLPTMYDVRTKLAREILAELRRHFGHKLLPVVVHFNSKLKEAASFGQPITEYDPASRGMQDFENLAGWLMNNAPETTESPLHAPRISNPTMSRAEELVGRARALSARTAALTAKLAADPDVPAEEPEHHDRDAGSEQLSEKLARLHGVRQTSQGLLFIQPDDGEVKQVAIAGDFNDWSPTATPLKHDDNIGVFQACIPLPPGRYRYRLVIDGHWIQDPYNTYVESNPFGELNNVVEVETS